MDCGRGTDRVSLSVAELEDLPAVVQHGLLVQDRPLNPVIHRYHLLLGVLTVMEG